MTGLSKNFIAVLIVLACFLGYNIADAFLNGVVDHYHFGSVAFYPLLSYLCLFLIFSQKLGGFNKIKKTKHLKLHIVRALFALAGFIGFIIAIRYITLAQTYTLVLSSPFWVALISVVFLGHKIGLNRWIAIIIGFIGVLIALQPDDNGIHIWASFAALICGLSAASIALIVRKMGEDEPLINNIFFPAFFILVTISGINTFWLGWQPIASEHIFLFAMAGAFFFLADISFSKGFGMGETTLLAPLHYSQIIWGALIGYFFFAETPSLWTILGATLIVLSGIYMIHREHKIEHKTE